MKKLFVVLFVLIAIFAFASCKQDPKPADEPTPTPAPEPEPEPKESTIYVLKATAGGDRFQFKWDEVEESGGKVFTLKYKTDKTISSVTTRDPNAEKYLDCAAIAEYISEADDEGWITFTCTIPEGEHDGFGIAFFPTEVIVADEVFKVKDIKIGDEEMELAQANSWAGCSPTISIYVPEVDYYRLTATRVAKRFALQYAGGEGGINPKAGDVLTLKYRTNHVVTTLYLSDAAYTVNFQKKVDISDFVSEADEDGWIAFSFTYPEDDSLYDAETHTVAGILLQLANYDTHGGERPFDVDEYLDIKDLAFNGEKLTIDPAGEEEDYQSDHGVWNATNTDHTRPTLEVIYLD